MAHYKHGEGYKHGQLFEQNPIVGREAFAWTLIYSLEYLTKINEEALLDLWEKNSFADYGYSQPQLNIIEAELTQVKTSRRHKHIPSVSMGEHVDMRRIKPVTYCNYSATGETNKLPIKLVRTDGANNILVEYQHTSSPGLSSIALPIIHRLKTQLIYESWGNKTRKPLLATLQEEVGHTIEKTSSSESPHLTFFTKFSLQLSKPSQAIVDAHIADPKRNQSVLHTPIYTKPGETNHTKIKLGPDGRDRDF